MCLNPFMERLVVVRKGKIKAGFPSLSHSFFRHSLSRIFLSRHFFKQIVRGIHFFLLVMQMYRADDHSSCFVIPPVSDLKQSQAQELVCDELYHLVMFMSLVSL